MASVSKDCDLGYILKYLVVNCSTDAVPVLCPKCVKIVIVDSDHSGDCQSCENVICLLCGGMEFCNGCGGLFCSGECYSNHKVVCKDLEVSGSEEENDEDDEGGIYVPDDGEDEDSCEEYDMYEEVQSEEE